MLYFNAPHLTAGETTVREAFGEQGAGLSREAGARGAWARWRAGQAKEGPLNPSQFYQENLSRPSRRGALGKFSRQQLLFGAEAVSARKEKPGSLGAPGFFRGGKEGPGSLGHFHKSKREHHCRWPQAGGPGAGRRAEGLQAGVAVGGGAGGSTTPSTELSLRW